MGWDVVEKRSGVTTEVWTTSDFQSWQFLTNTETNTLTVPKDKSAQFFKIRNRWTNAGQVFVSDWARKK